MSIFTESMYGTIGNWDFSGYDPVIPIGPGLSSIDKWWFRGPVARSRPPPDGAVAQLPAGGSWTVEIACNWVWTSFGYRTTVNGSHLDACPQGNPGPWHAGEPKAYNWDPNLFRGCALGIADVDSIADTHTSNIAIFSVQKDCVKYKDTTFDIPAKMPKCSGKKCICGWFWQPANGTGNFYMTAFDCNITNVASDAAPIDYANLKTPVHCPASDPSCTKPQHPMQPFYVYNTPANVVTNGANNRAGYFDDWGFYDGAQDYIFQSRSSLVARQETLDALSTSTQARPSPQPRKKPLFNKILIANRGEIACRVIRTARALGVATVAVFSEADRNSQHVKLADEAYFIGTAPSSESYLRADKIVEVCKMSGAQAVHPGYGFLSESSKFAKSLEKEGIVFIGPPASAIESMGSKSESKDIMLAAGVPCVPGWHPTADSPASTQEPDFLIKEADKIGYPVLIKAVSGGGGKGMKIVEKREEFVQQLESAKRESKKSFGDDTVLLEKYLSTPRHVEVQIFSDTFGNHVSLFERDCSVQRRHQKVIEEAPAPGLAPELREDLYDKARKAAEAVGYTGAGTVEFIMDANNPSSFYFMEMNTRLQVEHPVTEAVTGVDLVEWQLEVRVAAGNPIPLKQDEIKCSGHAFECRIYAENPSNNFLPDTGLLRHVRPPAVSGSIRMETGFGTGDEISVYYDPLIAKLIVHGSDRTEALRVLRKALGEYQVVGPHTNIEFLKRLAAHPAFIAEDVETGFIPKHYDALFAPSPDASPSTLAQAGIYLALKDLSSSEASSDQSPWSSPLLASFRIGGSAAQTTTLLHEHGTDRTASVVLSPSTSTSGNFDVQVTDFSGAATTFENLASTSATIEAATSLSTILGEHLSIADIVEQDLGGAAGGMEKRPPAWLEEIVGAKVEVAGSAKAPMPSRIVQVYVKVGDKVDAGSPLVMVEAMKTEHVLRAPVDGVVSKVAAAEGELVPEGKVLVEFETDE
ncbi:3-methylcrotonyl-CoA carboxylase alpha subunit [Pseudohyphozyma bogoriensis]|nr:3-methylcrotonyl-CoA carboxylase alpha subunit [Pseudohyphozyma bogoriensis]